MTDSYSFSGNGIPYLTGTLESQGVSPQQAQAETSGNLSSLTSGGNNPTAPGGTSSLLSLAGPLVAGGGLLYDLTKGDPASAPVNALTAEAGQLQNLGVSETSQGQGLQSYLEQGTLPPAQQAQVELAQNAAKAKLIQGAATRGQNTNPLANSGLTQDLNSLSLQSEVEKGQLEQQLFNAGQSLISSGQQALGMEAGIQEQLAKIDQQQQADTTNAIMSFAKALGGMNWGQIGTSLASLLPAAAAV
jgi:hypothetical protein